MFGLRPLMIIWIRFIVFENKQVSTIAGFWCVRWDIIKGFEIYWLELTPRVSPCWTDREILKRQSQDPGVTASNPSFLGPASKDLTSASVLLCDTAVSFLHVHEIGTKVWLPKMHSIPPDIQLEFVRSFAKSASWNRPNLQSLASLPT